jgi:hypothetical protein
VKAKTVVEPVKALAVTTDAVEKSTAQKPAAKKPTAIKPVAKSPASKKPTVGQPVARRATAKGVSSSAQTPPVVEAVKAAEPANKVSAEKKAPAVKKATAVKKVPVEKKVKGSVAPKAEKPVKAKKPKLVRDSFTIPDTDFALFASIKKRLLNAGIESKKSEILRAALINLAKLEDAQLASAMSQIERIKTGRPKK